MYYVSTTTVSVEEMPSDAAKRRQQQKRDKRQAAEKRRAANKENSAASKPELKDPPPIEPETTEDSTSKPEARTVDSSRQDAGAVRISPRSCTGVLTSHPLLRDVHIEKVNLTFHGAELLCDARLELNAGRKYGLVGLNGSGENSHERLRSKKVTSVGV